MTQAGSSSAVAARELTMTRVFDAPRGVVFAAWTDPAHLAAWWGPKGFTNPRCEVDVQSGGAIRIDMRAPDGTVYPMSGQFREVVPPERLVFTSIALDSGDNPIFVNLNTVDFEEFEGGKTLLKLHVRVIEETGAAEQYLKGMEIGWGMSFDRLADYVAAHGSAADRELRATRVFRAPRELVWRMWTEAEHVAQWWGPRGFTTTIHHMDVRPGGEWRFVMHGPDGRDYTNHRVYEEVVPPELLAMKHIVWPHHRMIVRFADTPGGTEVGVRMVFESAEDFHKVVSEHGAEKGLQENLDRLGEHLTGL
jgi:uncharacterized protein YndB with AHSA1/START domain